MSFESLFQSVELALVTPQADGQQPQGNNGSAGLELVDGEIIGMAGNTAFDGIESIEEPEISREEAVPLEGLEDAIGISPQPHDAEHELLPNEGLSEGVMAEEVTPPEGPAEAARIVGANQGIIEPLPATQTYTNADADEKTRAWVRPTDVRNQPVRHEPGLEPLQPQLGKGEDSLAPPLESPATESTSLTPQPDTIMGTPGDAERPDGNLQSHQDVGFGSGGDGAQGPDVASAPNTAPGEGQAISETTSSVRHTEPPQRVSESSPTRQIANHIVSSRQVNDAGSTKIEVTLDPPELGRVSIQLAETNDRVTVRVLAIEPATLNSIKADLNTLVENLREAGIDVEDCQCDSFDAQSKDFTMAEDRREFENRLWYGTSEPESEEQAEVESRPGPIGLDVLA